MKRIPPSLAFILILFLASACNSPSTAAGSLAQQATANPNLVGTAQADQYWRDAEATTQAHQMTIQANYQNVQGTAQAATGTAVSQQTRDTLDLAMTVDAATVQAQETAAVATTQAEETAIVLAQREAMVTSTAASMATAGAFTATRQSFELTQAELQAKRQQITTIATYVLLVVFIAFIAGLGGWFFWQLIPTLVNRAGLMRYGQHGNPLLLTTRGARTVVTDPLRMLQASLTIDERGTVTMPELTPNHIQTMIAGGVLHTLIEQAKYAPGHRPQLPTETIRQRRLGPLSHTDTTRYGSVSNAPALLSSGRAEQGTVQEAVNELPASVSWPTLAAYQGNGFALGLGQNEIISLNPGQTPHILLSGSSGTGKTRRILRPLIAQALGQGILVILLNESGADFAPFYDHPSAILLRGDAHRYMAILQAALVEMERREAVLRASQVSEWSRLSNSYSADPPTLLVIDEILSLTLSMSPADQKAFWGLLATYASRARKLSMGSVGALTDPTYRVLGSGLNWREQCTARITFRVAKATVSRAVLDTNGAETLPEGQFLAMLGSPEIISGTAANPSDEELTAYLAHQPNSALERPSWARDAAES